MSADVLPFPIARRRDFIATQAEWAAMVAARLDPDTGTLYLKLQIKIQQDYMRRNGIAEDLVQRELRCMEAALGAQFINGRAS
jgi:hypothetical protein